MNLQTTIFELIDTRSFSNMWYWIALVFVWSTASQYVLGVPFEMVMRAKRKGGQAQVDLEDMVRINCNRILYVSSTAGVWLVMFVAFILTGLGFLGFSYRIEFSQAVFLIAFPMAIVGALSLSTAHMIREKRPTGPELYSRLGRHRLFVQIIGLISIFITAMWGMYQNMTYSGLFSF